MANASPLHVIRQISVSLLGKLIPPPNQDRKEHMCWAFFNVLQQEGIYHSKCRPI